MDHQLKVTAKGILTVYPQGLIFVELSCNLFFISFPVAVTPFRILFVSLFVGLSPNGLLLHADGLRWRAGGLLVSRSTICHLPRLLCLCFFLRLFVHREEGIQPKIFPSQEAVHPSSQRDHVFKQSTRRGFERTLGSRCWVFNAQGVPEWIGRVHHGR